MGPWVRRSAGPWVRGSVGRGSRRGSVGPQVRSGPQVRGSEGSRTRASKFPSRTSHVARRTSHVARGTSARGTSARPHVARPHVEREHVAPRTSHVRYDIPMPADAAFPTVDPRTGRALLDVVRGCTFDDFILTPQRSIVVRRDPSRIDLSCRLTRGIRSTARSSRRTWTPSLVRRWRSCRRKKAASGSSIAVSVRRDRAAGARSREGQAHAARRDCGSLPDRPRRDAR